MHATYALLLICKTKIAVMTFHLELVYFCGVTEAE